MGLIERVAVWNTCVALACGTRVSSIADTARGACNAVSLEGGVAVCNTRVRCTRERRITCVALRTKDGGDAIGLLCRIALGNAGN